MRKIIGYSLIVFVGITFGCLPARKVRTVQPARTATRYPGPVLTSEVDQRIQFLNQLLEEKKLSSKDKKLAIDIRDTYQALQRLSSSQPLEARKLSVIDNLYTCLSILEKKHFSRWSDTASSYAKTISLFAEKKKTILDAYISGDFQAVINLCIELKQGFGPDSLTPDIGVLFALSLAREGMLDEAIHIGEGVAKKLETGPDLIGLRTKITEWYLQKGAQEKAISEYEKLADILDEKGFKLQTLSSEITSAEKPVTGNGSRPRQPKFQRMEEISMDQFLDKVSKLLEENRFSEARELLVFKKQEVHSTSDAETINRALTRLKLAEENYLDKKLSMLSINKDMEKARKLLEEEKFEQVISMLEAIEPGQDNNGKIEELKQFAIEKLINRERNRAAKIFLAAKKTQDPSRKKEYLQEALTILNPLVDKYPLSPLNQKLKSNIEIVKEELDRLKMKGTPGSE